MEALKQILISSVKWRISVIEPVITEEAPSGSAISKKSVVPRLGAAPQNGTTTRGRIGAREAGFYTMPYLGGQQKAPASPNIRIIPGKELFVGVLTDFLTNPKKAISFVLIFLITDCRQ
jgi:hypothetical protein